MADHPPVIAVKALAYLTVTLLDNLTLDDSLGFCRGDGIMVGNGWSSMVGFDDEVLSAEMECWAVRG